MLVFFGGNEDDVGTTPKLFNKSSDIFIYEDDG